MKIGCILVLHNPDIALLNSSIDAIYNQIDLIYLADNSTEQISSDFFYKFHEKCFYCRMNGNIGIASAQNCGIKYLINMQYDYIIFMDQDSIAPNNLISQLLEDLNYLKNKRINVGGIGPRIVNRQNGKAYMPRVFKGKSINENITEVEDIISSASLISINNFFEVGLMEDALFIDAVDSEWCWRAKYKRMRFFISENVKLSHQLGEGDKNILGIRIAIPTPFRTFYQFRNYFILVRRKYVPLHWKVVNGIKYTVKYFYYPLMLTHKIEYFKQINRGIFYGICVKHIMK